MARAKMSGRSWYPISSASRMPCEVTSSVGAPARSSNALVATVVPSRTEGTRRPRAAPCWSSSKPMPRSAGSVGRCGSRERTLHVCNEPSGAVPTTSVNVPPRSTANAQPTVSRSSVCGNRNRLLSGVNVRWTTVPGRRVRAANHSVRSAALRAGLSGRSPVWNPRPRRMDELQRDAWHDVARHAEACTSCPACTFRARSGRCRRAQASNRRHHRSRAQDSPRPGDDIRFRRGARRTPAPGPTRRQGIVRSATGQRRTVAASRCGRRTHRLSGGLACARAADFPAARRRCRCCTRPGRPGPAWLGRSHG